MMGNILDLDWNLKKGKRYSIKIQAEAVTAIIICIKSVVLNIKLEMKNTVQKTNRGLPVMAYRDIT